MRQGPEGQRIAADALAPPAAGLDGSAEARLPLPAPTPAASRCRLRRAVQRSDAHLRLLRRRRRLRAEQRLLQRRLLAGQDVRRGVRHRRRGMRGERGM